MPSQFGRRSSRVPKEIAILLIGSDIDGRVFSEETKTVVLSQHGAGILSQYKLAPEQEVVIRQLDTQKEADVRVVGQIGAQGDVYTYGVAFLNPHMDLWGIEFPPVAESDKLAGSVLLECSGCRARELFAGDMEADVSAVNEGLVRYCKRCGSSTLWRQASNVPEAPAVPSRPQPRSEVVPPLLPAEAASVAGPVVSLSAPASASAATPQLSARAENRRKHARTKVSWPARVRRPGHGDDMVVCQDMSRGGLCFKSRQPYERDSIIEVAVPYRPGEAAIFVPARIVHVQELPARKGFRCGAAYVKGGEKFV